jgi:two-component system, sensor histidine kinase SagS
VPLHPPNGSFRVRLLDRLSVKQAIATLVIALVLGIAVGGWQTMADFRVEHERTRRDTRAELTLIRGLAIQAAYQLSEELAGEVVGGLSHGDAVAQVILADEHGNVLARFLRQPTATPFPALAEKLFGDIVRTQMLLAAGTADGAMTTVGTLTVRLDSGVLLNHFLDRLVVTALGGAASTALLCALVVAVFYVLITTPLLKMTAAIAKVDPARPGALLIGVPRRHARDELGVLAGTVNAMLAGSQSGLDGRDRAEAELAALARDLEHRVEDRTAELAREKDEVERANASLEKANQSINDGIRYASRIQTALLPDGAALDGIVADLVVGWQPLDIVGGDYYWMGQFAGKGLVAVMDCTGHGVPGAFMTAVVASALNRVLTHHGHDDPATILAEINRLVRSALRQDRDGAMSNDGLDAAICVIDPAARRLTFAGANLPLVVNSAGEFRVVRGDRISLGYSDTPLDPVFTTHHLDMGAEDRFYLFTDGITDQVGGPQRRLFGRRRVIEALAHGAGAPLATQMERLLRVLAEWRGTEGRRDDMTFIGFQARVAGDAEVPRGV